MIFDVKSGEFGLEGKVRFDLFNTEIKVIIDDDADLDYAEKCAEALNELSQKTIDDICKAAKSYCLFFLDECDGAEEDMPFEVTEATPFREILKCIRPSCLLVHAPEGQGIGIHLECECGWEIEHGMELTLLDDELVYCGSFEDAHPWDEYVKDEEWNFAKKI